jgi:dissimilatory sulfite reductase (desulfoviridin) alpha/beta subunit
MQTALKDGTGVSAPLTAEQIKQVKGLGFLHNKNSRNFSARVITENGILTNAQMAVVLEAARRFGNGDIAMTSRLTLELPGIPFEKINEMIAFLEAAGIKVGGTGSRVRPVVVCKGTTCTNGLCDTAGLGTSIHRRFYEGYREVTLPHKFKIGLGGCPNNCIKPDLNDIGLVAVLSPQIISDNCKGCAKCGVVAACPMEAASVKYNKIEIDAELCNACGACVGACPFSALEEVAPQYRVFVGGRWGKKVRHGSPLSRAVSETEALDMIEKAILLFKKEGRSGERFADTIERLGMNVVEPMLYSSELLDNKQDILAVKTVGGAKC